MQFLAFSYLLCILSCSNLLALAESLPASTAKQVLCRDHERSALLQFKQCFTLDQSASFDSNARPKVASWEPEAVKDCCSWDGVECNEHTGHVIGLDVSSSFLYGSLNSSSTLFSLVHLRRLNLADNNFNFSQIPPEISRLSRLSHLNLSSSVFSGKIPMELAKLSNLISLDLNSNFDRQSFLGLLKLDATIFTSLVQNLTRLKILYLETVHINSTVPEAMGNMSSLTYLSLYDCGLIGKFPRNIFLAPNLQAIVLDSNMNLTGTLPDEFHQGSALRMLTIQDTGFSGSLPASLANLTELKIFNPCYTNINGGGLSWISQLHKLESVCLTYIDLQGELPSSLANLTQLSDLQLSTTNLNGRIPSWVFNLTQLTELDLSYNNFHGEIGRPFFELRNLQYLALQENNLNGKVEAGIFLSLKKLVGLNLSGNNISFIINTTTTTNASLPKFELLALGSCNLREFPSFLQYQDDLHALSLSNNMIDKLPEWLAWNKRRRSSFDHHPVLPWPNLFILDLSNNLLEGSFLVPPPHIGFYLASNNMFTGKIPAAICNFRSLAVLDLSNNKMSGNIPPCLGNFSKSLQVLNLKGNNFQGNIPQACGKGSNLQTMDLSQNQLQGLLPQSFANCKMLKILILNNNLLEDGFPFWLGALPNLQVLILSSNKFHGTLRGPKTNFHFQRLRIIDLSSNYFTGSLTQNYFFRWNAMKDGSENMTYMELIATGDILGSSFTGSYPYSMQITNKGVKREYEKILNVFTAVDLSSNKFTGEVPDSIGSLQGLQLLNLSNNVLSGGIPSSIGNLSLLECLDLSQNLLSGRIPQQVAKLSFLAFLNVSYNNLSGPIPLGGQFNTFLNASYMDNLALCGYPLSRECASPEASRPPPSVVTDHINSDEFLINGADWIVLSSGIGSGVVIGIVFGGHVTKRKHEWFVEKFGKWPKKWKSISLLATSKRNMDR